MLPPGAGHRIDAQSDDGEGGVAVAVAVTPAGNGTTQASRVGTGGARPKRTIDD